MSHQSVTRTTAVGAIAVAAILLASLLPGCAKKGTTNDSAATRPASGEQWPTPVLNWWRVYAARLPVMPGRIPNAQITPSLRDAMLIWPVPDTLLAFYTTVDDDDNGDGSFKHLAAFGLPSGERRDLTSLLSRPSAARSWSNPVLIPRPDGRLRLATSADWVEYVPSEDRGTPGHVRSRYRPPQTLDLPKGIRAGQDAARGPEPVAAIRLGPEKRGEYAPWRDTPFSWIDIQGQVLAKSRLSGRLVVRDGGPRAVRRTVGGGFWAVPSYDQGERGPGDVPADDIRVLRVEDGKTSVIASVAAKHSFPTDLPEGWNRGTPTWDDSDPAWLAESDTLVYRRTWHLINDDASAFEALQVYEIWARPLDGEPTLLAVSATYTGHDHRGRSATPYRWRTGPDGRIEELQDEKRDYEDRWSLVPHPALFGPYVAYLDQGEVVTVRVPTD